MRATAALTGIAVLVIFGAAGLLAADQPATNAAADGLPVAARSALVQVAVRASKGLDGPHVATAEVYTTTTGTFWSKVSHEGPQPGPDHDVYVLVLRGRFTCNRCPVPPGAHAPRGTMAVVVLDRHTLKELEFGLGGPRDVRALGPARPLRLP